MSWGVLGDFINGVGNAVGGAAGAAGDAIGGAVTSALGSINSTPGRVQTGTQRVRGPDAPVGATQMASGALSWDTSQDAAVGALDRQIADQQRYQQAGSNIYDPKGTADLQAQRATLNQGRWQSALAQNQSTPAFDQIRKALADGSLTLADLGNIDISALHGDDAALSAQVTSVLAAKAAPVAAAPAPAAPADPTQDAANKATSDLLPQTQALLTKQGAGLKAYDQGTLNTQNEIGSVASTFGHKIGGADAGAIANRSGTANQANQAAGRDVLQKDQYAELNSFLNDATSKAIGGQIDMTSLNTDKQVQIQGQAMAGILDELKKSMSSTDEAGQKQLNDVQDAINRFNTAQAGSAEQNNERMAVIKLVAGLALGAATGGAGASAGTAIATGASLLRS